MNIRDFKTSSKAESLDVLCVAVEAVRAQVEWSHQLPSPEDTQAALSGCLNSRTGQWRKTAPPARCSAASLLWRTVKWHMSGGSLWGLPHELMLDRSEEHVRVETLAMVLAQMLGGSSAMAAWERALGAR